MSFDKKTMEWIDSLPHSTYEYGKSGEPETETPCSPESVVESVRVTQTPQDCGHQDGGGGYIKHAGRADYRISWTEPNGVKRTRFSAYCSHPFCDRFRRLSGAPPRVLDSTRIPDSWPRVAMVYLLLIEDPEGRTLPEVQARIGICSQWLSPDRGNYGLNPDGTHRLFSQRYFGESGPGVYPIPIEDERPSEWCSIGKVADEGIQLARPQTPSMREIYGDQLDQVIEAHRLTVNFGDPMREPGTFL